MRLLKGLFLRQIASFEPSGIKNVRFVRVDGVMKKVEKEKTKAVTSLYSGDEIPGVVVIRFAVSHDVTIFVKFGLVGQGASSWRTIVHVTLQSAHALLRDYFLQ
jgi:hypothetical protein